MSQSFDPGCEFNERPELGDACDASRAHLAHLERLGHHRPGVLAQLFDAQRYLLRVLIDPQDFHRDVVAGRDRLRRVRNA